MQAFFSLFSKKLDGGRRMGYFIHGGYGPKSPNGGLPLTSRLPPNRINRAIKEILARMIYKIMVVDDDRVSVLMVETALMKRGFNVMTAADGEEAWAAVREAKPDLVISDILLPKMDGLELCRRIKSDPELSGTRVILMTAVYRQAAFRAEAGASGADGFEEKPLNMLALVAKIEGLLKSD
jgi:CheY-like chemotaxis protein